MVARAGASVGSGAARGPDRAVVGGADGDPLSHLKRRALQIGYKLLYYRFINGVQGPRTESEKDVFGDSIKKLLVNYS